MTTVIEHVLGFPIKNLAIHYQGIAIFVKKFPFSTKTTVSQPKMDYNIANLKGLNMFYDISNEWECAIQLGQVRLLGIIKSVFKLY